MGNTYPLSYVSSNLNKIISELVDEYSEELSEKADKITEEVARDFAEKLKEVTPRSTYNTEHLADTVTVTTKTEKSYGRKRKMRYVHYRKWQISHLLEFGWTLKNGKRIDRKPFVRPLFDNNRDRYYRMYREGLGK